MIFDPLRVAYWRAFDWDAFAARVPAGIEVRSTKLIALGVPLAQGLLLENKPYAEWDGPTWNWFTDAPSAEYASYLRVHDFDLNEDWPFLVAGLEFKFGGIWKTLEEVMA